VRRCSKVVLPFLAAVLAAARPSCAQTLAHGERFGTPGMCSRGEASPLVQVSFNPPPTGGAIGPLLACDTLGVTLGPFAGADRQVVDVTQIRTLSVRTRSGLLGAVWGGLIGGLAGYAIGSSRTHLCAPPPSSGAADTGCHGDIIASTGLGLVAGAGLGWFFGRGMPRWKVIYRMNR